jgi:hypothetical protein
LFVYLTSSNYTKGERGSRRRGAIGAALINWFGSFVIAGCCKCIGFESWHVTKKEAHGV